MREIQHFVRFGQCQIQVEVGPKPNARGVWDARYPTALADDLGVCLDTAIREEVDVLILPELALTLSEPGRRGFLKQASATAKAEDMIIVAGSFYDADRYSRLLVIGPDWTEAGYKVRPSRFEVSPLADDGMKPGNEILALKTNYGTLLVITCVDLISDEVQFLVRSMATRGQLDVLININHNEVPSIGV
jgi:predicted amidohydrolase